MAAVTNIEVSIDKDVANANISYEIDVEFDQFDQDANVPYELTWRLYGDDTGQDGDDGVVGDDPLSVVWRTGRFLRSNGRPSIHRSWSGTVPYGSLDEDKKLFPPHRNDDEVRMKFTLTPQLPAAQTFESQAHVLIAS